MAAVLQVRDGVLQALLWQRALEPFSGAWALPGGVLAPDETLEASIRRHLAVKVDLGEVAHLEQVATYGDPGRNPVEWEIATAYLGLVPLGVDPSVPTDTGWHPVDDLPPPRSITARSSIRPATGCAASCRTRTSASPSRRRRSR